MAGVDGRLAVSGAGDAVAAAMAALVERARASSLRSSDLAAATLTVTALGELGADAVHGIIYPPQVALMGFGRIHPTAWAEDGRVEARQTLEATLAADHRASDGFRGGRFLAAIAELLAFIAQGKRSLWLPADDGGKP